MNEDGRLEITEWIVWLALLLLAGMSTLPFVNEGNVDRYLRVLLASSLFILPLIIVFGIMFPRGLRLPLGRLVLRIAPPAAYFLPYYSASRWLANVRNTFAGIADEIDACKGEQDAMRVEILRLCAEIAGEIGLATDPPAKLASDLFFLAHTNNDAVLGAATAAEIDALREKIAQPTPATTAGILRQVAALEHAAVSAIVLIRTRMATFEAEVESFGQAQGITGDVLTQLEQRQAARAEQTSDIKVTTVGVLVRLTPVDTRAALAAIEAEIAAVTQPGRRRAGRPPAKVWSDAEIRDLHAAYLVRGVQTAIDFAKSNNLSEGQMFKLFRRVGISKKGDSEFGQ